MYLPPTVVAAEEEGDKYLQYHITLKSNNGFSIGRLVHGAYDLMIKSIDDIFDGDDIWECAISHIDFDPVTKKCYVGISS